MFTPEVFWPIGSVLLLVALVYGMIQYKTRNRANDRITEKATETLYDDPAGYTDQTRDEFKKDIKPS